jgi:hypothetical protein
MDMRLAGPALRWLIATASREAAWSRNMLNVPLRWPRITTRRLMALVAVAALASAAEMTRRRGEAYAKKAVEQEVQEGNLRAGAKIRDGMADTCKREAERGKESFFYRQNPEWTAEWLMKQAASQAEEARYEHELAAFHEKLKIKYQHAARYPWLPVEPDPPRPRRKP